MLLSSMVVENSGSYYRKRKRTGFRKTLEYSIDWSGFATAYKNMPQIRWRRIDWKGSKNIESKLWVQKELFNRVSNIGKVINSRL